MPENGAAGEEGIGVTRVQFDSPAGFFFGGLPVPLGVKSISQGSMRFGQRFVHREGLVGCRAGPWIGILPRHCPDIREDRPGLREPCVSSRVAWIYPYGLFEIFH